jgi:signal transduction histidine kinase
MRATGRTLISSTKPLLDTPPDAPQWLIGGGEMGEVIRCMDWSDSPLGPLETWPPSLRTTVNLCLASNFPINIIWGSSSNQIYNDAYRVIVGDRHPAGMGMPYDECWASAWPAIGRPFEQAWDGEPSFLENQRMYLTRNGYLEETFFSFSLSPIRDEQGAIVGLFHPVTETTARMVSERRMGALRELVQNTRNAGSLESAFRGSIESLAPYELDLPFVLLYSLSDDGKQAMLVEACGISRGLPASPEVIDIPNDQGWPVSSILASNTAMEIGDLQQRFGTFASGQYEEGSYTALAHAVRIPGVDQPLSLFIAGVSSRLPLDDSYRDHFNQLSLALSATLANAVASEQQRRRDEMLAEINSAKMLFFTNVSHEFRTPLALILGPIETLLATKEDFSISDLEQLKIARRNSLRLLKLVNTLLDFSGLEAGRTAASFEPLDLASWTREISGNFQSAIESAGLDFRIDCPPLGEPIYVDREMWEKIVLNLLSNALKFTLQGRIDVALRLVADHVELTVTDTGCGIASDDMTHVFERFHRVVGAPARTHEGSGIGLSLVDEFARLHFGSVSVESQEGVGSTFRVVLPRGKKHLPQDRIRTPQQQLSTAVIREAYTGEAARWSVSLEPVRENAKVVAQETSDVLLKASDPRIRILLAEDNADMRDYIVRIMGPEYEIETVADGRQALASLATSLPDLILTDVMMPSVDGFDLLRSVRSDARTETLPIILFSARAGEEARVEGIERGADDYLVKPFSSRELKARVRTQLQLQNLRREVSKNEEFARTADALRQSERLAVVGRLASSIAHEINNPLEAITNLLYLAESILGDSEAGEYVRQAQSELGRVANITTQALRFPRQSVKPVKTSVTEVLESVLSLFQGRRDQENITVVRQFQSEQPIIALAGDLRQVFANIFGNALDASSSGDTITLRVRATLDDLTGERGVRVVIADRGAGMSEATRLRVFEPFFTTKELTGTGLGLWISSEILQAHKAKVRIRSSRNSERHGTVFRMFFPTNGIAVI